MISVEDAKAYRQAEQLALSFNDAAWRIDSTTGDEIIREVALLNPFGQKWFLKIVFGFLETNASLAKEFASKK